MEDEKLKALLLDMSPEEKAAQLMQLSPDFFGDEKMLTGPAGNFGITPVDIENAGSVLGISGAAKIKKIQADQMAVQRHHIPMLFMADVINGFRTAFPIPLAQGASFNPEIAKGGAAIAAAEAAVSGLHVTFAPMADLARDARWGRVMESCGEDRYLNSVMTAAMVAGYQGDTADGTVGEGHVASCLKHFAAYGAAEGGRDYNNTEISERTLLEEYLPAYESCVKAGAMMAMCAFSTLNRVPASANPWLLRYILREKMGFDGTVISDWASVEELIKHGVAEDKAEAAYLAIKAGVDIDMASGCYGAHLAKMMKQDKSVCALVDEAVLRVLCLKNKLGLFENPFKDADEEKERALILCGKHRAAARAAVPECCVLLENDGILPLDQGDDDILFAGPFADNRRMMGNWAVFAKEEDTVTVKTAVGEVCAGARFINMPDILVKGEDDAAKKAAEASFYQSAERVVEAAKSAKTVVLLLGEHRDMSGEAHSRTDISLPKWQMDLFESVTDVNRNVVVVLFTGRPLCIKTISEKARALLVAWHPGTEGGHGIADVLFGTAAPSGKLPMSFPYSIGQVPVFYNGFVTGRPELAHYLDAPGCPLYPFGYGKTYTTFEYSKVYLSDDKLLAGEGGCVKASVFVKNTGSRDGAEVVQLYVHDVAASVVRPVRELKGFKKVFVAAGTSKEVSFEIFEESLKFYRADMTFGSEAGKFIVYIGGSSDTQNSASFVLCNDLAHGGDAYELS